MSPKTIDLDFYIPAKDSEKYIRPCLESIFKQTLQPRSVTLFLHTPCQDQTRAIAEEFPVTIREVNVPLSDVRNIAIHELTSEWIGCCDVDVVLEPQWLEKLWEKHQGNYTIIAGNTQERIKTFADTCRSILSPHNWGQFDVDNPYNFAPDMIVKRKRLIEIGGYKSGLFNYEDSEICQRLKQAGDLFYYVAGAHAIHIREDDFISWLNQRWNYSFPRQKELFESLDKFKRKIINNIVFIIIFL
ncbi:MAG: glycosyltransferase family 2 protein [Deltaproteobacteria bacterium]|nr:MAG: glycosyltransferase family 2 protein [Deltaproteobacteria bacterium]